jgi:hypothetical protein
MSEMINEQKREITKAPARFVCLIVIFVWAFAGTQTALAQWTTNGNNINNTNTGNVGVGTTTPGVNLNTVGTGVNLPNTSVYINGQFTQDQTNYRGINLGYDSSGQIGVISPVKGANISNKLAFWTFNGSAWAERVRIEGDGNVGIGTTTPGSYYGVPARLDVSGATFGVINTNAGTGYSSALTFSENGTAKWALTSRNTMDAPNNRLSFLNNSASEVFTILSGGNVGIGTSQPNASLQVNIPSAATKGFIIKGAGSQTGNIFEFQDSNGTVMSSFSPGGTNTLAIGQNGYMGQIMLSGATISTAYGGKVYFPGAISVGGGIYDGYNNEMFSSSVAGVSFNASTNTTPSLIGFKFNANLASTAQKIASFQNAGVEKFVITYDGKVGVGTSNPQAALDVNGNINVSGNINAKYQDVAEWVQSRQQLPAGTVVILDPEKSNQVIASTESYDTRVAGVISNQPGVLLGEGGEGKVKVATTGRVRVKVDATRGAIKIGDLLVTSDTEGVAMRSEPILLQGRKMHAPGTIIGKALEALDSGVGEIQVLLSLQ